MPEAARLDDPIAHSQALRGLIAGAVLGGLAAIAIVATAPLSVPVLIAGATIAGATVGGAAVGELLGSLSPAMTIEGKIAAPCSADVFVNRKAAARAHIDTVDCARHSARPVIAQGSTSVFINREHAARKGDRTACDAVIAAGSPNVWIGGGTFTTDDISPEVPGYVHTAMLLVGLASAAILVGPVAAAAGLAGGMLGGKLMGDLGGHLFGEGSDGQKLMAFGGALLGGFGAGKGGAWFERNYEVQSVGLGANGGNIRIVPRTPAAPATGTTTPAATFGKATSNDYRGTFFEAHPELEGKVVVHHAVEQQVNTRYPGVVKDAEMHSLENLRGIPKESNSDLHLSRIRREWNQFYRDNASPTKQQLLDKASDIDRRFGSEFNPPR